MGDRATPLWKTFLLANVLALALTVAVDWANNPDTLAHIHLIAAITLAFTVPISVLALYSGRIAERAPRGVQRTIATIVAWAVSGALGSFLGYTALRLFDDNAFGIGEQVDAILLVGNGIAALVIGTMIVTLQFLRTRIRHRSALLDQQEMLTAEFQAARNVQQSLMPLEDLRMQGFDISGLTQPAVEIGGDYFDYLTFADGTKAIVVADAAGKGIPAALLMAKFQGMAQALSMHTLSVEEFFVGLNDTLTVRLDRRSFITVGMITIDFDDQCAFYRAGHNPLLVYRAEGRTVEISRPSGMALGLAHGPIDRYPIQAAPFVMAAGDIALLYSDGLTEATNESGDALGDDTVAAILLEAGARRLTAQETRTEIMAQLARFVGAAEPHDDITLVVVRKV